MPICPNRVKGEPSDVAICCPCGTKVAEYPILLESVLPSRAGDRVHLALVVFALAIDDQCSAERGGVSSAAVRSTESLAHRSAHF